ncbi:MAG: metalloregulator ArsR/SmtB family transcription factor [Spirochaetota bacterium]|nr:metalloregulator ArsR/SmtB family transcription factor [Spirochaetota bacterium]
MSDPRRLARIFKALSVDTRVRIIQLLKKRSLCVNALSSHLGISPPAVSQHLRVLRDAEIIRGEKKGYYVHYEVNEETLAVWKNIIDDLLII